MSTFVIEASVFETPRVRDDTEGGGSAKLDVNYLRFFVMAVNKNLDEVGLIKPITIKDLDNLDQDTLVKLIVYLLCTEGLYKPEQILGKTEVLIGMQEAGYAPLEYDATLDNIFWAAKRLFPEGDDRLSYGLLLQPDSNPKLVKEIIEYLVKFSVFVETCGEAFEEITKEVAAENVQRNELHRQIDEVRAQITEKVADMEEKRAAMPSLQEKLNEMNQDLAKEEDVLADLENEVANYQKIYEAEEQEILRLERKLEELLQNRARLEQKIVASPTVDWAQTRHKAEFDKLNELIQEREEVGAKLDALTAQDLWMDELVNRGEDLLIKVGECNASMVEIGVMMEEHKEADDGLKELELRLKTIVTNLKYLCSTRDKIQEQNEMELKTMQTKLYEAEVQLESLRNKIETMKGIYSKQQETKVIMEGDLATVRTEIGKKDGTLAKNENWIKNEFQAEMAEFVAAMQDMIAEFKFRLDIVAESDDLKVNGI